jgi:hypothetical protein
MVPQVRTALTYINDPSGIGQGLWLEESIVVVLLGVRAGMYEGNNEDWE